MKNLIFVVICLLLAAPCSARIITVDDDGGADFDNIQAAITDANNSDTIVVVDGIYTDANNRDLDFGGKAITVRSTNPNDPNVVAATIIDCNGSDLDLHRGFIFDSGETASSVLSGFTIINGYVSDFGGAIKVLNSSPTITNCNITGNSAGNFGGSGGGIYCYNSSAKIENCTVTSNSAPFGGGICCEGSGSPIINYCTIADNSASSVDLYMLPSGGGIYARASGSIISNCMISGNSAPASGAGIYYEGDSSIEHCIISGNYGSGYGGGIYCEGSSSTKINNCIITDNSSGSGGGIEFFDSSSTIVTNCTLSGNSASSGGGISSSFSSSPLINNSILWSNGSSEIYDVGGTPQVTYCVVQGGYSGLGNIDADPCFADVGANDFHLKSQAGRWNPNSKSWVTDSTTSPCIDAGNPADPIGLELFPNGGFVNMGAYGGTAEASKSYFGSPVCETIVAGDINGDCIIDFRDFAFMALHWLEDNTP